LLMPIVISFTGGGSFFIYILVSIWSLTVGILLLLMVKEKKEYVKVFVTLGTIYMSLLAIIFSINIIMQGFVNKFIILKSPIQEAGVPTMGSVLSLFGEINYNVPILFALALIAFNLPLIYYQTRKEGINLKLLIYYLIPIVLFILLSFLFKIISNNVLQFSGQ
jgi:hypothetical protein